MASATPKSIIDDITPYIGKRVLDDAFRITVLNQANDHFCAYANWRWLCRAAAEIDLSGTQTYNWTSSSPVAKVVFIYAVNKGGQITALHPFSTVPEYAAICVSQLGFLHTFSP